MHSVFSRFCLIGLIVLGSLSLHAKEQKSLNVLFIGNSYTARHNLSEVVKSMAEEGNPGLEFKVTTVIYGGRTLKDHWRLGTHHIIRLHELKADEETKLIANLEKQVKDDPADKYAKAALKKHQELIKTLNRSHAKWDIVVLQSYRDDLKGEKSAYVEYAPQFADLIHKQGTRVILYETTPTTQNAKPLTTTPDKAPVLKKTKVIADLANRVNANVAPMALAGWHCQNERPDLPQRFINDAHLNQNLAYLTACNLYAAIFEKSPVGLSVNSVTDIRYFKNSKDHKDKDRDGLPITRTFSDKDRKELQSIAWKAFNEFQGMRK